MLSRPSSASEPLPIPGRVPGGSPVAVIDIGSNSVRLVVYERLARSPTPLFNEKILAGLGSGVAQSGKLAPDAVERTRNALRRFTALTRQMDVAELNVVATAAIREAENGADLIRHVEAICGVRAQVLSGGEEARIAALGVVAGFQHPDGVAGDLGGGSLELIEVKERTIGAGDSLPLGGLRLQAGSGGSLKQAREVVRGALDKSAVIGKLAPSLCADGGRLLRLTHDGGYPRM